MRKGLAIPSGPAGTLPRMTTGRDGAGAPGMRFVFWLWMATIIVGLTVMIAIPLTGR